MDYQQQANDFAKKHGITMEILGSEFRKHFDDDKQKREVYRIRLKRGDEHYDFDFGSSIQDSCSQTPAINTDGEVKLYCGLTGVIGEGRSMIFSMEFTISRADLRKIDNKEMSAYDYFQDRLAASAVLAYASSKELYNFKCKKLSKYQTKAKEYELALPFEDAKRAVTNRILKAIEDEHTNTELWDRRPNPIQPTMYDILACLTKYDPGTFENFCGDFGYDEDSRKAEKTYHAVVKEWQAMERLFTPEILEEMQEIQ